MPFSISKPNWTKREICISIWCALTFVGLGTCLTVIGPTLLDIAAYIGVGLAEISAMMFVRSVGSIFGAVGSGLICDYYQKYSLWMTVFDLVLGSALTAVLPLSNHLAVFGVLMFFHGVVFGGLDNGIHALLFALWKDKDTGPVMQLIHFMFAFGAFISPLITRPFLSDINDARNATNMTVDDCNTTDYIGSGSGYDYNIMSISTSFQYAYWIAAIIPLIPLPGLLGYAIKEQCCCLSKQEMWKKTKESEQSETTQKTYPHKIHYLLPLMSLLFLFMFVYVGLEVAYGTYIFTYGVKQNLFSKPDATILTSVFWGSFAFFRFFSISLSICKVSPSIMLSGNLTGSLIASIIIAIWPTNVIAIWIGSAIMGISFASIYPNVVVWLTRHGPATGRATSVLSAGAILGDITLPVSVGVLIAKVGPISLIYFMLAGVLFSVCIMLTLFSMARFCRVRPSKVASDNAKYKRLEFDEQELIQEELNSTISDEDTVHVNESKI